MAQIKEILPIKYTFASGSFCHFSFIMMVYLRALVLDKFGLVTYLINIMID